MGPVAQKTIRLNLDYWKITEQNFEHPLKNVGILFSLILYELINVLFCEACTLESMQTKQQINF